MNINNEQFNNLESIAEVNSELQATNKNYHCDKSKISKATLIVPHIKPEKEQEEEDEDYTKYELEGVEYENREDMVNHLQDIRGRLFQKS